MVANSYEVHKKIGCFYCLWTLGKYALEFHKRLIACLLAILFVRHFRLKCHIYVGSSNGDELYQFTAKQNYQMFLEEFWVMGVNLGAKWASTCTPPWAPVFLSQTCCNNAVDGCFCSSNLFCLIFFRCIELSSFFYKWFNRTKNKHNLLNRLFPTSKCGVLNGKQQIEYVVKA